MEGVVEQGSRELAAISNALEPLEHGLQRLLGCWHLKLSLPFTRGTDTYRTCIRCGARRRFDLEQWKMTGGFYYPKG